MMLKHTEIEIPNDDPFKNCKLNRKSYAVALSTLISSYSSGFVLSLNNPWGTGKTTFIKMWRKLLQNNKFRTLYFNAWENDFDTDPMIALMSELGSLTDAKLDATFNSLIKKAAVISHSIIPSLLKALAARYVDTELLKDVLINAGKGTNDLLKDEIDEYTKKKTGLIDFKTELEKYISNNTDEKPLVLFVDELDRCRPSYAVELLEQIKHFFNVPGIVFVLSIDKIQLGNAVRGFYGSEQINSTEYLRRFIDLEFVLPDPKTGDYVEYLYEYFGFDEFLRNLERIESPELANDKKEFISFATLLFTHKGLTLRQLEKLFSHARVALRLFTSRSYLFPSVFIMLLYLKDFHVGLFNQLNSRTESPQNILDEMSKIFPIDIQEEDKNIFIATEASLIKLYYNYYKDIHYTAKIYEQDENRNTKLLIKPYTDPSPDFSIFINAIDHLNTRNGANTKLSHLLAKINLLEGFHNL